MPHCLLFLTEVLFMPHCFLYMPHCFLQSTLHATLFPLATLFFTRVLFMPHCLLFLTEVLFMPHCFLYMPHCFLQSTLHATLFPLATLFLTEVLYIVSSSCHIVSYKSTLHATLFHSSSHKSTHSCFKSTLHATHRASTLGTAHCAYCTAQYHTCRGQGTSS